jgi:hypothetical protein
MKDEKQELRIIAVSATVHPAVNEEELAANLQAELRANELFEGSAVEFGTVDVYEHNAHSGGVEE